MEHGNPKKCVLPWESTYTSTYGRAQLERGSRSPWLFHTLPQGTKRAERRGAEEGMTASMARRRHQEDPSARSWHVATGTRTDTCGTDARALRSSARRSGGLSVEAGQQLLDGSAHFPAACVLAAGLRAFGGLGFRGFGAQGRFRLRDFGAQYSR